MSAQPESEPYLLGDSEPELARLVHQHEVWRGHSDAAFDRAGVAPGWRVLDAGCGPGLVLADLGERVGSSGETWGVDLSPEMVRAARAHLDATGHGSARILRGDLADVELPAAHFDLVWLRWVLSFPESAAAILRRLASRLRPGGTLVVQDYNHDGVGLFPESEGFQAAIRATREAYAQTGGDPWIGARLPKLVRDAGLEVTSFECDVQAGGPDSPVFQWAGRFFLPWADQMVAAGTMSADEAETFRRDWAARSTDPDAMFFSPIVVTLHARRPS